MPNWLLQPSARQYPADRFGTVAGAFVLVSLAAVCNVTEIVSSAGNVRRDDLQRIRHTR